MADERIVGHELLEGFGASEHRHGAGRRVSERACHQQHAALGELQKSLPACGEVLLREWSGVLSEFVESRYFTRSPLCPAELCRSPPVNVKQAAQFITGRLSQPSCSLRCAGYQEDEFTEANPGPPADRD